MACEFHRQDEWEGQSVCSEAASVRSGDMDEVRGGATSAERVQC